MDLVEGLVEDYLERGWPTFAEDRISTTLCHDIGGD